MKIFWPEVEKNAKMFFLHGIFPFLYTTQDELTMIEEDPEEFVSYVNDIVGYQVTK